MGHSEMLLAVAGMSEDEVEARAMRLADGAWEDFPPAEREAFRFARKLTAAPWTVGDADVAALTAAFGPERALDVIWHVAWGNYMTRIADAFQLPLETTNVFAPPKPAPEAPRK
jgi:alkylhydroperoxidase family enzyme